MTHDLATPASVLAVGAHPDDVEFGAGATLAKWAASGCVVHHLICTDGSKGTWDADADTAALAVRRQAEQREAARLLSATDPHIDQHVERKVERRGTVTFLGCVDGELDASLQRVGEVARVIRTVRPEVILGHDPWKRYRLHPDHRNAGLLVCDAIVAARDPHFFRDHGLPHHRPKALLLWEADAPDHAENVEGFIDRKLAALEAHVSQFESTMDAADASELDGFRTRIRTRLAEHGADHGVPAAEIFKLITDL